MNPKPTGHIVQRVHVNSAGLDDGELAHRARVTWRCGVCGATITDEDPSGLRHRAAVHRGCMCRYTATLPRCRHGNPALEAADSRLARDSVRHGLCRYRA